MVEPIGFTVPRKATQFQEDIFPPTNSSSPALSAAEWASGKTKTLAKVSLKDGYTPPARAAFEAPEQEAVPAEEQPPKSEKELLAAWHAHKAEIKALKSRLATYEIKLRGLGETV